MHRIVKGIGVVGSTTIDTIVSQHRRVTKIGGATAYAGMTYSRHGLDTFVVTNIADNDRTIIDRLEQEKITVLNGKTNRTTHFVNDIKEDPRRQELFNRARSIKPRRLSAAIKRLGGLHLGPLHPDDIESKALTALHNTGFKDISGYSGIYPKSCDQKSVGGCIKAPPGSLKRSSNHQSERNRAQSHPGTLPKKFGRTHEIL